MIQVTYTSWAALAWVIIGLSVVTIIICTTLMYVHEAPGCRSSAGMQFNVSDCRVLILAKLRTFHIVS